MHAISDLEAAAHRRLPRRVYDFIAGGAGSESSVSGNTDAFAGLRFKPRTMVEIRDRTLATRLLDRDYSAPFGISPMGMCDIAWPGTDQGLALTAREAGLPYCLSMAGSSPLTKAHEWAREYLWYQIYPCSDQALLTAQLRSAENLGVKNLILTVDVPVPGRRTRDIRNGFSAPMKWTPSAVMDFALYPTWSLTTLLNGAPRMRNMESFMEGPVKANIMSSVLAIFANAVPNWEALERLREQWKQKLIIKGVLNPDDATRMVKTGTDAIIVSNHGGRQLGSVMSTIDALPAIRKAVGPELPVILDSGIRSGEDIAKAICLGADFVMAGRPFLFGSAALGPQHGPKAVVEIFKAELDSTLAQIGCTSPEMLSPAYIDRARHAPY